MTFRKMSLLFIGLLLILLFISQYWLIQNFTKDVSSKIGEGAFEVSRSTIETLLFKKPQIEFSQIAISNKISVNDQHKIINSISNFTKEINISLRDGQIDKFLTISSDGKDYQVKIPRTGVDRSLDDMSNKILLSAIAFIAIGLIIVAYFSRKVSSPLKSLQLASEEIGTGNFGYQINNTNQLINIEIDDTISAFNKMSVKIKDLQEENEALQKRAKLAEISEITRGLAHTIRNPLNTLNLAIDELSSTEEQKKKDNLNRISKHQVQRIDKWVRAMVDLISSDAELVEPINVTSLLKSCVQDLSINATSKTNILLTKEKKEDSENITINGIIPELKSLFQSLISNAIEAVEDAKTSHLNDAVAIKISRVENQTSNEVNITISDRGKGFSKDVKGKLFSPHNTDKTYGAGMGLYLANQIIVIKYNGKLDVEDNPIMGSSSFRGATITITLQDRV